MILRSLFLSASLFVVSVNTAFASDMLASMKGDWVGDGWATRTADGPKEGVRCLLKNSYIDISQRLVVKGICAVPGKKFKMNGTVSGEKESNQIKGRWSNPFGIGSTAVTGEEIENTITLNFTARHPDTGKPSEQIMQWKPIEDGFELTTQLNDDEQTQINNLTFKRR